MLQGPWLMQLPTDQQLGSLDQQHLDPTAWLTQLSSLNLDQSRGLGGLLCVGHTRHPLQTKLKLCDWHQIAVVVF